MAVDHPHGLKENDTMNGFSHNSDDPRCEHIMRSYGVPPTRCCLDSGHSTEHGSNNWPTGMDFMRELEACGAPEDEIRYAAYSQLNDMLDRNGDLREWSYSAS